MDDWQDQETQEVYDPVAAGDFSVDGFAASGDQGRLDEPVEDQVPDEDLEAAEADADKPQWYVVHCYSGYENKVKKNLEHRAESMGMLNRIFEVIVPTEEQVELRDGQRRVVERRIYPGYVLVRMVLDEESWYVVRNTPSVTGFVGIGTKPTPLRQEEVDRIMRRMEAEEPVQQVKVKIGDRVRVVEGSFTDFNGVVDEVYAEKGKARILVSFFNRETPIEVDLLQIERV
ncbi:MAG: transcription termination/antitermination protein NusG [Chloroflexi bacterium HGW-Chloroflexi-1]|nr:MAG: transcription termination/antitermination protein NusG [Chloroflexi bacterium HGW-Chloroflexi-1]